MRERIVTFTRDRVIGRVVWFATTASVPAERMPAFMRIFHSAWRYQECDLHRNGLGQPQQSDHGAVLRSPAAPFSKQ